MTIDELHSHLTHLIYTYVADSIVRRRLLALVVRDELPAKHVLAELTPYLSGRVTDSDERVIKEIVFNFC